MKKMVNKYEDLSKKQLIQSIEEMEEVINNMEKEKNDTELLSLPWIGNLGQWSWMVKSNKLIFNEKRLLILDIPAMKYQVMQDLSSLQLSCISMIMRESWIT